MADGFDMRELRERLGWTQEEMASYLGVDRSSVSRMEGGAPVSGPAKKLLDLLRAGTPTHEQRQAVNQ